MIMEVKVNCCIEIVGDNTKLKVRRTNVEIGHKFVNKFQRFCEIIFSHPNGTVHDENYVW